MWYNDELFISIQPKINGVREGVSKNTTHPKTTHQPTHEIQLYILQEALRAKKLFI